MAIHHNTLKAAVNRYKPMVDDGKTDEEILAEIANDDKKFDDEEIKEIFAAIKADDGPEVDKKAKYIVVSPFRSVLNFNVEHKEGEDVSGFDEQRLKDLINLGLVKEDDK